MKYEVLSYEGTHSTQESILRLFSITQNNIKVITDIDRRLSALEAKLEEKEN